MRHIEVHLDSVRKERGKSEWRDVPRATCLGKEVVGDGQIIIRILSELVLEQKVSSQDVVHIFREGKAVFLPREVDKWVYNKQGKFILGDIQAKSA